MLKITFLPPHLYLTLNLKVMPLECGDEIRRQKTRIMGMTYDEEIMIVGRTMWEQSTSVVTDRQTDRQTDGQTNRQTCICMHMMNRPKR